MSGIGSFHLQRPSKKKRGRQRGSPAPKRRDDSHLPARTQEVDVPDDAKVCACCGLPLEGLGQHEDSEQIEIETVTYRRVVRRKRYRRTCKCTDQPQTVTAALPPKLLPKSVYGTSVWVHLLLEKFQLQRPMHRIISQLQLFGLDLDLAPGTIVDGLMWADADRAITDAGIRCNQARLCTSRSYSAGVPIQTQTKSAPSSSAKAR